MSSITSLDHEIVQLPDAVGMLWVYQTSQRNWVTIKVHYRRLIFSLKWHLLSLSSFSIPLPFIFQEAKESIDEEDPRPTSSNGAYIIIFHSLGSSSLDLTSSRLIFYLKLYLHSSFSFSIPLPFIFQEAKESIDEEDPRPTSSNEA